MLNRELIRSNFQFQQPKHGSDDVAGSMNNINNNENDESNIKADDVDEMERNID